MGSDGSCRGGGCCAAWNLPCFGETRTLHDYNEVAGGLWIIYRDTAVVEMG